MLFVISTIKMEIKTKNIVNKSQGLINNIFWSLFSFLLLIIQKTLLVNEKEYL